MKIKMREILFRGKRLDNGEWVEGAFLNDRDGAFYICPAVSDISYGDGGNRRRIGCWYKVDPSTVGQYTGLNDKNGKRIFEGDIVTFKTRVGSFKPHYVRWYEENARFIVTGKDGVLSYQMDRSFEYEVIGNIHDNKLEDFDNWR